MKEPGKVKNKTGKDQKTVSRPEMEESRFITWTVRALFGLLMALVLGLLFFGCNVSYIHTAEHASNLKLLFPALFFFLLLGAGLLLLSEKIESCRCRFLLPLFGLGFLVLQLLLIYSYYFRTAWDVNHLLSITEAILENPGYEIESYYLSMYPNNQLLVWIFVTVGKLLNAVFPNSELLFALIEVQCVIGYIAGLLMFRIAEKINGNRTAAVWAYIAYLLMIGLSPWMSIPYSDVFSLIFPMLTLFFYTETGIRYRWLWIGLIAVTGYHIKPQTLIVDIAVLIVQAFKFLRNRKMKGVPVLFLRGIAFAALGALTAVIFVTATAGKLPVKVEENRKMGITHYLMMGLNSESSGGYSDADVELSYSIEDPEVKRSTELATAKERLSAMGVQGYLNLLHSKLLSAYNDGSFFWGGEGLFFYQLNPENSSLSAFTRDLFYKDTGSRYTDWLNIVHGLWLAVLVLAFGAVFFKTDETTLVMMLSVVGLTAFELIFEVRSRHLIAFVPIYLLLASRTVSGLGALLKKKGTEFRHVSDS